MRLTPAHLYARVQPLFRRRRMRQFRDRMLRSEQRVRILDVGGVESFWSESGILPSQVTILSLHARATSGSHPFVQA
ncbi:MAG: hypothetical protein ACRD2N_21885, partial [Vicinamibacterales bacterium]